MARVFDIFAFYERIGATLGVDWLLSLSSGSILPNPLLEPVQHLEAERRRFDVGFALVRRPARRCEFSRGAEAVARSLLCALIGRFDHVYGRRFVFHFAGMVDAPHAPRNRRNEPLLEQSAHRSFGSHLLLRSRRFRHTRPR